MAKAPESGCMRIADAGILQRRWQGIAIELRVVPRARHSTNVNESAHRVSGKQSDKLSERARRVTDGQHRGWAVMLHLDWPIPGRQRIDFGYPSRLLRSSAGRYELPLERGQRFSHAS